MFVVKKDDLVRVLSSMQSVVERKSAISVLSNVKIMVKESQAHFVATDMDICAEDVIPAEVSKEYIITVPASTLYDIVRKISGNPDVKFFTDSLSKDMVKIAVENSSFSLPTIDASEFPSFEDLSDMNKFVVSSSVLLGLLNKTRHAISSDETRYYLNGVYIHTVLGDDGVVKLVSVATDGHRMALAKSQLVGSYQEINGAILPKKAVSEASKMLDAFDGMADVFINSKKIVISIGSAKITSKLIDGRFPDYQRVIPKDLPNIIKCSADELKHAVELVTAISSDKTKTVKLTIENSIMVVNAYSEINGNAQGRKEIAVEANVVNAITINFNSRYLLDVLNVIDSPNVVINYNNATSAVSLVGDGDESSVYVLMPMQ